MNLNWDSLLEPIFLFILSLLAGTLWIIIPTDPKPELQPASVIASEVVPLAPVVPVQDSKPAAPPRNDEEKLRRELAAAEERLQQSVQGSQLTTEQLNELQRQNERVSAEIQNEQRVLDGMKAELRSLEQQLTQKAPAPQNSETLNEARTLAKLLADKKAEESRAQAQFSAAAAGAEVKLPYVPTAGTPFKLPVLVEFIHNRVVPVTKESFRIKESLTGPAVATRKSEGDSIGDIAKPSSLFSKFLAKMKPDKEYLSCLLNPDSFEAFREARKLAQQKGIDVGWEPVDTSSGQIVIYRARLLKGSKAPKGDNLPRAAPILK